jgi:hypothetical protein
MRSVLLLLVLLAQAALAVARGGALYVAGKDVKLLKDPKAGAKALLTLPRGTEVKWLGPSEKDKHFHEVEVSGKKGFVLQSDLSPSRPQAELAGGGQPSSPQAFASSAEASRDGARPVRPALGAGYEEAAKQLEALEALNRSITPAELAKKQQELREAK